MMHFFKGFFTDFQKGNKYTLRFPFHIEELFRFPAWFFVFFLAKMSAIRPGHIVLAGFFIRIAAVYLIVVESYSLWAAVLLILAPILDCMDGQLARYTKRVSANGGLFDLASDFVCTVFIYIAIGVVTYDHALVAPLVLLALICHLFSATIASFVRWRSYTPGKLSYVKKLFLSTIENDRADDRRYTKQYTILNRFFMLSWHPITKAVFLLLPWGTKPRYTGTLHLYSFAAHIVQFIPLALLLITDLPLSWYVYYQIILCIIVCVVVCLTETTDSASIPLDRSDS